jgi:hypothetical protein
MSRLVGILLSAAALVCASVVFGEQLSDERHAPDYQSGWNAGYNAREQLSRENDRKLIGAGLCVYATLACGAPHAKR